MIQISLDFQVLGVDRVPAVAVGERLRRHRPDRLEVQDGRSPIPRLQPRHGRLLHGVRLTANVDVLMSH